MLAGGAAARQPPSCKVASASETSRRPWWAGRRRPGEGPVTDPPRAEQADSPREVPGIAAPFQILPVCMWKGPSCTPPLCQETGTQSLLPKHCWHGSGNLGMALLSHPRGLAVRRPQEVGLCLGRTGACVLKIIEGARRGGARL